MHTCYMHVRACFGSMADVFVVNMYVCLQGEFRQSDIELKSIVKDRQQILERIEEIKNRCVELCSYMLINDSILLFPFAKVL